jgi:small subunit ribosomal protein S14
MSKLCMKARQKRRDAAVAKDKITGARDKYRAILQDPSVDLDEKFAASEALQKLPRDSAKCRSRRRCWITGRGNGVYRAVGMCRNMFRIYAMQGDIPGIHKASW